MRSRSASRDAARHGHRRGALATLRRTRTTLTGLCRKLREIPLTAWPPAPRVPSHALGIGDARADVSDAAQRDHASLLVAGPVYYRTELLFYRSWRQHGTARRLRFVRHRSAAVQ